MHPRTQGTLRFPPGRSACWLLLAAFAWLFPCVVNAQTGNASQSQDASQASFTLKINSDIVLTNVIVRDKKTGEVVTGLKPSDFTVLENGKPQRILSLDFENVDDLARQGEGTVSGAGGANTTAQQVQLFSKNGQVDEAALRNRRLIVMMFDLSSMQVEDLDRAVAAAKEYVQRQMQPADLVAIVSLGTSLSLDQDFTSDKSLILRQLNRYNGNEGQGMAAGGDGTTNGTQDLSASYTPDESEYNYVNTDVKLYAIEAVSRALQRIPQRKSLLFFSGGLTRTGIENQASLNAAINASVRANLSIYTVDVRGLEALPPVGDAQTASLRGNAAYSGAAAINQFSTNYSSQETLSTLSTDTGGKAFFDSNDFAPAFQRIQRDTAAYYEVAFRSSNLARDGKFRKLTVRVKRPGVKLEYRPGYWAAADFRHSTNEDRERQLDEELASDLPATDMMVYLDAYYFWTRPGSFIVPVSLIVPGSQVPFVHGGDQDKATLDVIGEVRNHAGIEVGNIRDTVKLKLKAAQDARQKNIQYTTSFALAPGTYRVKFVVRENESGRMGSFQASITVPEYKKGQIKLSSVVLSNQKVPFPKKSDNPLVVDGAEWVPNVPHVFQQGQHMYLLYQVYDPAHAAGGEATGDRQQARTKKGEQQASGNASVRVLANLEMLDHSGKALETPLVVATRINLPRQNGVGFLLDVLLNTLQPGLYTCQVNVIDDVAGSFSFPRLALLVRPAFSNAANASGKI
ncbi:MAG: VWA domain-containing protein [Acidobacteriaceae bacterium]